MKALPRIILLAATTGYQTQAFTEAARRLHLSLTLATDRCHILENPWHDSAIPIRFDEPAESAAALAKAVKADGIEGIVAVGDRPTVIAALTAEHLGLPWHPPAAAIACRSKLATRRLFESAGLLVPRYGIATLDADPAYPCVLKPLSLSASRGVIRADDRAQFEAAFHRIRRLVAPGEPIQVEEYIPGTEFALEGVVTAGELRVLALFDKPDPLVGPFFEETIYTTPSRAPQGTQQAIRETCAQAIRALGLTDGPIHAEMRLNSTGVYMLEIAARPIGGLCARALRFVEGTLEEILLLHALRRAPLSLQPAMPASGVMMIPIPGAGVLERVTGVDEAKSTPLVDDVVITAKIGEILVPLPEGASYPGFIFASGQDPSSVEASLRQAHTRLRFDMLATLPQLL